jgi:hypothetical protein
MKNGLATLDEFTGIKIADLDALDILELNFHAARGLPGTENSKLEDWLKKRDEWAHYARLVICRYLHEFDPASTEGPTPGGYGNSLAHFMCWYLGQALSWCGVKYHPDRKADPDSCLPPEVFANGILDEGGKGGCCASIPVVIVSVARLIGLPLFLVSTRRHLFSRWYAPNGTRIHWKNPDLNVWIPPARFNVDISGDGISFHDDEYYRQKPCVWKAVVAHDSRYLECKTPREEFGDFLMERGGCFWMLGQHEKALQSFYYARQLIPDNAWYDFVHALRSRQFLEWQKADRAIEEEFQIEQWRRIPGADGHSRNCECGECHRLRSLNLERRHGYSPATEGHLPNCPCAECRQQRLELACPSAHSLSCNPIQSARPQSQNFAPDHGPSCQCFHCREAKTDAATKMTGHSSSCRCAACLRQSQLAHVP